MAYVDETDASSIRDVLLIHCKVSHYDSVRIESLGWDDCVCFNFLLCARRCIMLSVFDIHLGILKESYVMIILQLYVLTVSTSAGNAHVKHNMKFYMIIVLQITHRAECHFEL